MTSRVKVILDLIRDLDRIRSDVDLAQVRQRTDVLERVDPALAALTEATKQLLEAVRPDPGRMRLLQGAERAAWLVAALEAGAKACGAGLYAADSLHGLVVDHTAAQDKVWAHSQLPGLVVGMLRTEPDIAKTLARRGVRIWEGKSELLIPSDELWRLVHLDRLTAHGDIRRWVTERRLGRCCQCCGITENPQANELQLFELTRRHGVAMINGAVAIAAAGGVLLHDECRSQWIRWVELASKYSTQAEAEAADAAAGRKPRGTPAAKQPLGLEKPIARRPRESATGAPDAAGPGGATA
jgi:hypothetical protein